MFHSYTDLVTVYPTGYQLWSHKSSNFRTSVLCESRKSPCLPSNCLYKTTCNFFFPKTVITCFIREKNKDSTLKSACHTPKIILLEPCCPGLQGEQDFSLHGPSRCAQAAKGKNGHRYNVLHFSLFGKTCVSSSNSLSL